MGGRTKPKWMVYEGGPLNGERLIISSDPVLGRFIVDRRSATPGMRAQMEYELTSATRRGEREGGMRLSDARVAQFIRQLPDVPAPPPAPLEVLPCPTVPLGRPAPAG